MRGAELITPALLGELWRDIGALAVEVARHEGGVQRHLKKQNSVWNVVGRVCLHLAEKKWDPDWPFAFIAMYVHKLSKQAAETAAAGTRHPSYSPINRVGVTPFTRATPPFNG